MEIDNNTIYYFFSTSAQVYSALLAILLTLLLFKIQRLVDKYKEESRSTLEKFVESTAENSDTRFVRDRIIWADYWSLRKDSDRIQYVKQRVLRQADLASPATLPGTIAVPTGVGPQFFNALLMHINDLDSLAEKTESTRKSTICIFIYGAIVICTAIAFLLCPDFFKHIEDSGKAPFMTFLILGHFLFGAIFFVLIFLILKKSTDLKEL